jgi:hypothetical protein
VGDGTGEHGEPGARKEATIECALVRSRICMQIWAANPNCHTLILSQLAAGRGKPLPCPPPRAQHVTSLETRQQILCVFYYCRTYYKDIAVLCVSLCVCVSLVISSRVCVFITAVPTTGERS